jgi:hypothetical protein
MVATRRIASFVGIFTCHLEKIAALDAAAEMLASLRGNTGANIYPYAIHVHQLLQQRVAARRAELAAIRNPNKLPA